MIIANRKTFLEQFDNLQVVAGDSRPGRGEDNFYCAAREDSAVIAAFDGSGGMGARRYENYQGHTGAYIASRILSGAVCDWYQEEAFRQCTTKQEIADSLRTYIDRGYAVCRQHAGTGKSLVTGTMVRDFPSTMAMALAVGAEQGISIYVFWAGDSRVYALDENGMQQLTRDDVDDTDPLDNITSDAAMTNVVSSDGRYEIHSRKFTLKKPMLLLAETDGCFKYFQTPMDCEYLFLKAMAASVSPENFEQRLYELYDTYAGDDYALGMMSFGYGSFAQMRGAFSARIAFMEEQYIQPLEADRSPENVRRLWEDYSVAYEQHIR